MLKALRNPKTKKRIFTVLAIVIIPAFAIWGVSVSNDDSKMSSEALGKIGNHKVMMQEYLRSYRAVQHEAVLRYGERLKEVSKYLNYKGEAWDRLLLLDHAKKEKLKVTDKEVVAWVTSQPLFAGKNGFDQKYYDLFVTNYLRTNAREFEEEVRAILTIQKIRESLVAAVKISDDALRAFYEQQSAERDLLYGVAEWKSEIPNVKVNDAELENVYNVVKGQLTAPAADGKPERQLTLEESKDKLRELMAQKDATDLAVKKLDEARAKMGGSDLESALKAAGLKALTRERFKKGAELPSAGSSEFVDAAVLPLKEGEVSKVVATPNGALIVKVTKIWPNDPAKFEENRTKTLEEMTEQVAFEEFKKLMDGLRSKLELNIELMRKLFPTEAPTA